MKNGWLIIVSMTVFLFLSGCDAQSALEKKVIEPKSAPLKEVKMPKHTEVLSEAIVVFEKGMSIKEAENIIASHDMKVLKVYKTLSKSRQKPMIHVASSLLLEEMMEELKADPHIVSISPNYQRKLYSK